MTFATRLEEGDLLECAEIIKQSSDVYSQNIDKPYIRSPMQELGIQVLLFANTLYY